MSLCGLGSQGAGLPPPPASNALAAGITLYLELVVNEQSSAEVVPVIVRDGHYHVAADVLRKLHVRPGTVPPDGLIAVDQIPGVQVQYDSVAQRLKLMLPADWLPDQELGSDRPVRHLPAVGSTGLLLNYDAYASNIGREGAFASLWTEQRAFGNWGLASNTGVYRRAFDGGDSGYVRYDTRWSWSDTETVRTYAAGDIITGSLPWGSSVRLGGVSVARNFAIRPDLVPYPLPRFAGSAAVPSAVDLFINGYKASTQSVQPGPFTLNTLPFINGAGEASVVTTDALGRQVLTTVPFYVANTLLKTGTSDYSFAGGAMRRDYGVKNFSYGRPAASGSYRYGLSDAVTLEGRAEMARGLALGGVGAVVALGRLGVVNGSVAHARSAREDGTQSGQQLSVGYQYNAQRFGFSLQHTRRTTGYGDLAYIESTSIRPSRHSTQATISGSLGEAGAISAGYFDVEGADGQRTRLASMSYTRPVGSNSFISVNLNKSIASRDFTAQLQWTVVFDTYGSASVVVNRDRRATTEQVQYSRTPPPAGGLGVNLSYANNPGNNDYKQASATWRGDYTQVQGGLAMQGSKSSTWAGAAGSIVVMDGGVFAANRINDAFALVSTSVPDVPVRFENQLIGRTNAGGHLLVTGVNAYYPARFEIDTLDLPEFMQVSRAEQRVLLRSGSGALLRFEIEQVLAANIAIVDEGGKPLPVGLFVQHIGSDRSATVGWDGLVYVEGLHRENELMVKGNGFNTCRVRFGLEAAAPRVARIGPLVCRPVPSSASVAHRSNTL